MRFNPSRRGVSSAFLLVLLALIVTAAVVSITVWVSVVRNPSQAYLGERQQQFIQLTGLATPVTNKLDPRYVDADGDLVADAPTDPAKLIDPPTLRFSYVTVDDATEFKAAFADLLAFLSKETGRPVEYVEFNSTEEQLRALRDGQLHVAGFNTGGVPIAVDAAGFVPVSILAGDELKGFYKMQIIVPADSRIARLEDLRGRELALTDASSNSGYKAPLVILKEAGLTPGIDYGIRYSGGQDASIDGIANRQYHAAAVASDVLKRAIGADRIHTNQFKVIHESGDFPSAALGYAHNLKPELAAKVRGALLKFDWKGTSLEKYFASAGQSHFAPADYKKDWELVRKIDDQIGYAHVIRESPPAVTGTGQ